MTRDFLEHVEQCKRCHGPRQTRSGRIIQGALCPEGQRLVGGIAAAMAPVPVRGGDA